LIVDRPTLEELEKLVHVSGFPLELDVARELREAGFEIYPSRRFFNRFKQRDSEIDLFAVRRHLRQTKSGKKVEGVLRVALECKSNSLPYVLFGLENSVLPDSSVVDRDSFYCHVQTTRDSGIGNRFAWVSLDEEMSRSGWSKARHHQLATPERFYAATAVEITGKSYKLHLTANLADSLTKLGAFADHLTDSWSKAGANREALESRGFPSILITFFLFVHAGHHFRWSIDRKSLCEAEQTTVLLNHSASDAEVSYSVDFVKRSSLAAALSTLDVTFQELLAHLVPIVLAQRPI